MSSLKIHEKVFFSDYSELRFLASQVVPLKLLLKNRNFLE